MQPKLDAAGATASIREQFAGTAAPDGMLARVCSAVREEYRLLFDDGECAAEPAGRLRWESSLPAVGDWVAARRVGADFAWIEAVLPRSSKFSRRAPGAGEVEQVIAANVDVALVVCGLDGDFSPRRIERYLVLAHESGAAPVVVLNKVDVCADAGARVAEIHAIAAGAPVVLLTATESSAPLLEFVRNRTVVLLGSSGAGKSTIVNWLLGTAQQATSAVRESDSKGRHTTTSRMLFVMPCGGAIIDSPGMREVQLWAGEEALAETFAEITALAASCRYRDCTHAAEPGCAIQSALRAGELAPGRLESFHKLQKETRRQVLLENPLAALEQKRKNKSIHKAMRRNPKLNR